MQATPHGKPTPHLSQPTNTVAPQLQQCTVVTAIDPALVPLPSVLDADLSDPPTIAKAQGHRASKKVAGSCQKGKGK